jgi:hypothetical protein
MQLHVLHASADRDLDTSGALVIGSSLFFTSRMEQLGAITPPRGAHDLLVVAAASRS